jgi:hypothetical protein
MSSKFKVQGSKFKAAEPLDRYTSATLNLELGT